MVSKKLRFEVFKRDGFRCQYCGRTPPEVILEADHIIPKSQGGEDIITNLITSCFDCNRGKGKNNLTTIPAPLASHLEKLKENQHQLEEYTKYLLEQAELMHDNIEYVDCSFKSFFPGLCFSDTFKNDSLKIFLKHLPFLKVIEALSISASKFNNNDKESAENAIRYMCGICWNWIKYPEKRDW